MCSLLLIIFLENYKVKKIVKFLYLQPSWDDDTDEFLKSMLTGADQLETQLGLAEDGSSDTSSDSGCGEEQAPDVPRLMSPGLDSPNPASPHSTNSVDLIDYIGTP